MLSSDWRKMTGAALVNGKLWALSKEWAVGRPGGLLRVTDPLTARRLNLVSLLLWVILVVAVILSLRPSIPVIWGDTTPFVESALRTLDAGRPMVVGGRDPAYPAFLALNFALGGDLRTAVLLQEVAGAALILMLAATVHIVTASPFALLPVVILAMYPGILMFRNIITAEMFYLVFLTLAVLGLLLATCTQAAPRGWLVAAAIVFAALGACFKAQGLLVLVAVILLGIWLGWRNRPRRLAPIVLSCAAALALILTLSRGGASASDRTSALFVEKTLFCNHLNIVLASAAARREMTAVAGERADALLARLATDLASKRGSWPVLGFFGDACLYDTGLDQYLATNGGANPPQASPQAIAATYRRIFLTAILDRPLLYLGKVLRQIWHGAFAAWPPYGLEPTIPMSTDDVAHVSDIMARHGLSAAASTLPDRRVSGWIWGDLGVASIWLCQGLSAAFVAAALFWIIATARGGHREFAVRGAIVMVVWFASILTSALAHTLDIARYLIPSTPMVALMLSLSGVEFARAIRARRRRMRALDAKC